MKKSNGREKIHKLPTDLRKALGATKGVMTVWKGLTPLARNEWTCWVMSAKKEETRNERIERTCSDLKKGKRRPCCWPGCPHRRPNAMKWFK